MKRRLPPLNAIRAFEAAARLQSISAAADELAVTPTAISHQIRQLENLLDVKLFARTGRTIQLTAQAERMLPDITAGMNHLAIAFEEVYGALDRSVINISTTREFASYWLQPRLSEFYALYPQYSINIFTSEQCVNLDGSEIDVAVRYGPVQQGTDAIYLFQEWYVATMGYIPLGDEQTDADISALYGQRLIDVRWEKSTLDAPTWKRWFEVAELPHYDSFQRMSVDAYNLAFDALKLGHGAALLSRTIVESAAFSTQLTRLKGPALPGYHYRVLNTASGNRKSAARHFIDWMTAAAAQSQKT